MRIAPLVVAMLVAFGCSKKQNDGLPPAQDWKGGQMGAPGATAASPASPHTGAGQMPPGQPPTRPELPPGHPPMPGEGMPPGHPPSGPDVTQMGLQPPDPNRKVDPNRRIRGTLKVAAKAKGNVKPGGAVFLIVKKADASGAPAGPPLAVDKVAYADNLKFELTEANAMIAGTELTGDVIVTARYDQDSDAISKQPGDVTGQARVKVPAENVQLTLDTVLP